MERMSSTVSGGLTRANLDALAARDDRLRYELLDGVALVTPSPSRRHQSVSAALFRVLDQLPPPLRALYAPLDVELAVNTIVQPDLLVVDRDEFADESRPIRPLLVVEILSASTRGIDQMLKRERYRQAGIAAYWIVDPDAPSARVLELDAGAYRDVGVATPDSPLTLTHPGPILLRPQDWLR